MKIKILLALFIILQLSIKNTFAEEIRGFNSKVDTKVGLILDYQIPFNYNSSNFPIGGDAKLIGENLLYGNTGLIINYNDYSRNLQDISKLSDLSNIKPNDISPSAGSSVLTKRLIQLTFLSPIYKANKSFEFGWTGGIYSQYINLNPTLSGDSNTGLGLTGGGYIKYYDLYPLVPFANLRLSFGKLYDNGASNLKSITSSFKAGYFFNIGTELYLGRNYVLNANINLFNPEILVFQPASITTQITDPKNASNKIPYTINDSFFSMSEQQNFINIGIGGLF